MLERVTHKINVACAVKMVITRKRVKMDNICELMETPLQAPLATPRDGAIDRCCWNYVFSLNLTKCYVIFYYI